MGLAALKHESPPARSRTARTPLRVVPMRSGRARTLCAKNALASRRFRAFTLVVVVIALLGMGRVWLAVQAAESSFRSGELRAAIKTARYKGDMLEIRLSALSSPARIQAVACSSMGMVKAGDITYLDIRTADTATAEGAPDAGSLSSGQQQTGVGRVLAAALDLAATEAQILLIGDVGLASAR